MARLSKKKVEAAARSAVEDCFQDCDRIHVDVATNDKTIAWDGFIYLYDDAKQKKDSLYGIIPVQVKGISSSDKHPEKVSYSIQRSDLRAYKDEGIAFFVVYINGTTHARTVYYSLLAPIEIKELLGQCGENKSKTVYFEKMSCLDPKGSMDSMQLKGVEKAKIECAKKLFNNASTSKVKYGVVHTYGDLLGVMKSLN